MATAAAAPASAAVRASASSATSSPAGSVPPSTATTTTTTTASPIEPVQEQIRQLNDARKLVLANISYYPSIVQGILPIISPSSLPELRRWGADFLAEAFAAPALPSREKETLSLLVLESFKGMLENSSEDVFVLRSIILASASIYPLVLRWVINNSYDTPTWERISAIKSRILRLWENPSAAVQICCIKFAQRVILAQTHSSEPEQKRAGLDISLSLVPQNHPLLDPRHLEAEATGLLDRMLNVLQDNKSNALIVDATLNTLSILVRSRPSTVNRTINAVLNFNPLELAGRGPMSTRTRVIVRSMEKTTRMFLIHLTKRDPHNALNPRILQYLDRLMRTRAEVFDDVSRKRALDQQAAAYGDAKRQKMAAGAAAAVPQAQEIPPLAAGQNSLADIFALTSNAQLRGFNVSQVPLDLAAKISVSTLARVDAQLLERAVQGIRSRLESLEASDTQLSMLNPETVPLDVADDDDDDYEPDFSAAEDAEQILNKLDMDATEKEAVKVDAASLALGAFKLPTAPPLTGQQVLKVGEATASRVFDMMQMPDDAAASVAGRRPERAGLQRVAASAYDSESWLTILTRLATRSVSGLEDVAEDETEATEAESNGNGHGESRTARKIEEEEGEDREENAAVAKTTTTSSSGSISSGRQARLNETIRQWLFRYILEDFRKRIDVAVAWLCEEWYNDQVQARERENGSAPATAHEAGGGGGGVGHYDEWVVKVLDGFLPYLHSQDNKVLTRFLSEVPALNRELLQRVKNLCRDPSMVPVALTSLLYQLMMRPPARALTLDIMQEIWLEFEDARPTATKYLDKWRPGFVQAHSNAASSGNGSESSDAGADTAGSASQETAAVAVG